MTMPQPKPRRRAAPPPYRQNDPAIRRHVRVLYDNGIETCESCGGGAGHAFPEPTVCFFGGQGEGFRALAVALQNGLRPFELRVSIKFWTVNRTAPSGP